MSEHTAITIPFEAPPGVVEVPDLRVRLEADDSTSGRASLGDIDQMLARAAVGLSARTVVAERCRAARFGADGEVILRLAVLVWPSRADLRYTLDLPEEAKPGPVTAWRAPRQHKAWVSGGGVIALPWRMERAHPVWAYGCWDARSGDIPGPALRHDQARIIVEGGEDVYGIVAVNGAAVGFRHEFSLPLGKIDDEGRPQRIDIEEIPITARWIGADGEEETASLDLPVPDCAKELLGECPDGVGRYSGEIRVAKKRLYEVAYNSCTGQMLAYRRVEAEG